MFLYGLICFLLGMAVAILNKQIARRFSPQPHRHAESITTSVTRQNILIIAAVLILVGVAFAVLR